jgi:Flp pilus assembly protein TadB
MFGRHEEIRKWLFEIVEKFRQKGAVSPDKAMTVEELGLPSMFREAMERRLGRSGIFVEVDGKYYLDEGRLKEIEEQRRREGAVWGSRNKFFTVRIARMIVAGLLVALFLVNVFVQSWELMVLVGVLMVVWLVMTVVQIYYLSRVRKRSNSVFGAEISQ